MNPSLITPQTVERRSHHIGRITRSTGDFAQDADRIQLELSQEIHQDGPPALLGHLRLCGAIPEAYPPDGSEEKLYSKYTDIVIHEAYLSMGLESIVLKDRIDAADVECVSDDFSFVADAKAFRLSRTAKNQKDFKIQAMDTWKRGKPFAMVVCPVYQLPSRTSQIYQQAIARSVCICTYTHLAALARCAGMLGQRDTIQILHSIFKAVEAMNPSKDATAYWQTINRVLLDTHPGISDIWREEKLASIESIQIARAEALRFLARERERIMKLSRTEAIREVLAWRRIESKVQAVNSVTHNHLLEA